MSNVNFALRMKTPDSGIIVCFEPPKTPDTEDVFAGRISSFFSKAMQADALFRHQFPTDPASVAFTMCNYINSWEVLFDFSV